MKVFLVFFILSTLCMPPRRPECDGNVYCKEIYCEGLVELHMFWRCIRKSDGCEVKIDVDSQCKKNGYVCNNAFYEKTVCRIPRQQCINAVDIQHEIRNAHCNKINEDL